MRCFSGDLVPLQYALWHHPTNHPTLKCGKKGLDCTSFSDLVEERYIDNFVIDICISKFLDDAQEKGKNDTVGRLFKRSLDNVYESRRLNFV